jgi:hypothetical protein
MKNLFKNTLLFLASFCFCIAVNGQTIRRVNNNPGVTGVNVYTTIQAAHDAAVAGDIVYVEPSSTQYAFATLTKRLNIFGNGYFIQENAGANAPQDTRESNVSGLYFEAGSENSIVTGVTFSGGNVKVPNITIDRCKITSQLNLSYGGASPYTFGDNTIIKNCYITGYVNGQAVVGTKGSVEKAVILNNIIVGGLYALKESVIKGNTFTNTILNYLNGAYLKDCIISDNIQVGSATFIVSSFPNCVFSNNMAVCNACNFFPTGNGNVNNVSSTNFFVTASQTSDKDYQLAVGSPGLTAGTGGGQVGAFGGVVVYKLAGVGPNPIIINYLTSGVGNSSTPLTVNVTSKGTN